MKKARRFFRHPVKSIEEPFGKAGLIVAICALVLATTGAAFAAAGLNSKQKKEVTSIAKKYAGKPGERGPAGEKGANGTNGTNGAPGEQGKEGKAGESVTVTESANAFASGNCNGTTKGGKGGSEFKVGATTTYACNGKEGHEGPAGPEGNIKATLNEGATETGTWSYSAPTSAIAMTPVSFTIPLANALTSSEVHFVTETEWSGHTAPAECPGNPTKPEAGPGAFCAYANQSSGHVSSPNALILAANGIFPAEGTATTGAVLFFGEAEEGSFGYGTWAVTAPEG